MEAPAQAPIAPGLRHSQTMVVEQSHTVPHVAPEWPGFVDMPEVLATAMMVGFVEQTCIQALRTYLTPEQGTVGTHIDLGHVSPTPTGMTFTADVELLEVDGRSLLFKVACRDEAGPIGEGLHRRAIIDRERFERRLREKQGRTVN